MVELVCFDINKAKSFEEASGKLKQCELSNFKRLSEEVAQFTSLYTNARNIHDNEYMTAYERFTLRTTKLPAEVEIKIQDYLATHKGIIILEMEWGDADDIINGAWGTDMNADRTDITNTGFYSLMAQKSRRAKSGQPTQVRWSNQQRMKSSSVLDTPKTAPNATPHSHSQ